MIDQSDLQQQDESTKKKTKTIKRRFNIKHTNKQKADNLERRGIASYASHAASYSLGTQTVIRQYSVFNNRH